MTDRERFEKLMQTISDRPGFDRLMNYIRKSDFYTAPASTRFHLSCEGGLLQHSLNVYDALIGRLEKQQDGEYHYMVAGKSVASFSQGTLVVTALLHDICKTNFYTVEYRNKKVYSEKGSKRDAGGRFDWQTVPAYAVDDKNPYGHGEKSVMMVEEFVKLSMEERYTRSAGTWEWETAATIRFRRSMPAVSSTLWSFFFTMLIRKRVTSWKTPKAGRKSSEKQRNRQQTRPARTYSWNAEVLP